MPTKTSKKSRAVLCRRSTKLKSCNISTRNGVGCAASKSKREICTEPEGSSTTLDEAGLDAAFDSQEIVAGARSVLNRVDPSGRHTKTASRRSSAVIFAR